MKCPNPIVLKNERGDIPPSFTFPCGKCVICKDRKSKEWTVRLEKELKYAKSAYFLTLTYEVNPEVLRKEDIQEFIKRLRRKYENLRYYVVGEYGGRNKRPHWHMLLFNLVEPFNRNGVILDAWKLGFIKVGDVNVNSIKYVLSYLIDLDSNHIVLMSLRPGIGAGYLENKMYHRERKLFATIKSGGGFDLLPRYYRDKFFTKTERRINSYKVQRENDKRTEEARLSDMSNGDNYYQMEINRIEKKREQILKKFKKKKL